MCLVSYIPIPNGFLISSNRDEAPDRAIDQLVDEHYSDQQLVYPLDTKGGSWIFASDKKMAAVVLNGAFVKHKHQPPYSLSRGVMLKKYFDFASIADFLEQFDFNGIEPFTSLLYQENTLIEFRWDGQYKYVEVLDQSKAHVFSSSTLYDEQMIPQRKQVFLQLLGRVEVDAASVRNIHLEGKVGDPLNDFVMNRDNRVRTVSFSQIHFSKEGVSISYENIISGVRLIKEISLPT